MPAEANAEAKNKAEANAEAKKDDLYVKPAEGLQVRFPRSEKILPPEGAFVPATTWWLRRLTDNDVTISEPPAEANAEARNKPDKAAKAASKPRSKT